MTGQHQTARFEDGIRFAELFNERIPVVGRTDYFIAKFTPDLSPVWLNTAGSDQFDFGTVVRVAPDGDIIATGAYQGVMDFHGQALPTLGDPIRSLPATIGMENFDGFKPSMGQKMS